MSTVDGWRDKNIPADVHKNELLSGYKIAQHIHRGYYWGGGNVVWRIVDPRGFEFEIESSNMSKILECTSIINGEIQGKCIIGRSNKGINILLPEKFGTIYQSREIYASFSIPALKQVNWFPEVLYY